MIDKAKIQAVIDGLRKDQEVLREWEAKQKANGIHLFSDSPLKKKQAQKTQNQYRATERKIGYLQYDRTGIKKLLASLEIPASKTHTTSVRGYHNYTSGYDLQDRVISVHGYGDTTFNRVKEVLLSEGYEIERFHEPSTTIGVGKSFSITIKPVV